jgi:hypothetical protein
MEKNKKIIKLCYLQIAFYVVFLTSRLCASDYPYAARLRLCTDAYRLSEKPDPPLRL